MTTEFENKNVFLRSWTILNTNLSFKIFRNLDIKSYVYTFSPGNPSNPGIPSMPKSPRSKQQIVVYIIRVMY